MVDEPDNLVLQILRDIRGTLSEQAKLLAEHTRFHVGHQQAFAELRDELQRVNDNATFGAGVAFLGRRDHELLGNRVSELEARVERLEERQNR